MRKASPTRAPDRAVEHQEAGNGFRRQRRQSSASLVAEASPGDHGALRWQFPLISGGSLQRQDALRRLQQSHGNSFVQRSVLGLLVQREGTAAAETPAVETPAVGTPAVGTPAAEAAAAEAAKVPAAEGAKEKKGKTYKVVKGDTPDKIAAKFGISRGELLEANKDKVKTWKTGSKSVEGFEVGAELTVPEPKPAPTEAAAEFALLKGKTEDKDAAAYEKHRKEFFGSDEDYQKWAEESDKELDGTKGLRRLIELKGDAQTVFYRWVRKAYHNAGVKDVPALIKKGKTKELEEAIKKVQGAYGKTFQHGGFNPRPKKSARYLYLLGTVSEHALGTAVDVESGKNPNISTGEWAFIEKLAGKTVDRKASRWWKEPAALWKDVSDLNKAFVAKVDSEVARIEKEREAAAKAAAEAGTSGSKGPAGAAEKAPPEKKGAKVKPPPEPIEVVFAGQKSLLGKLNKIGDWRKSGFFTLEEALVKQFHAQDFLWGATFSNAVDLHHFELSTNPTKAAAEKTEAPKVEAAKTEPKPEPASKP